MKRLLLCLLLCLAGCVRPKPTDVVTPDPSPITVDDSRYGLVKVSSQGAALVKGATKADEAGVIAQAHIDAADAASKSPYYLVADMQKAVPAKIAEHLSADRRDAWKPWQSAVAAAVKAMEEAGKLIGREDWIEAYREIAAGLKAKGVK